MAVDAVQSNYSAAQGAGAYTQPASAPDTSATQPPSNDKTQEAQSSSQPQQTQVYFFDANLGQYVNILV